MPDMYVSRKKTTFPFPSAKWLRERLTNQMVGPPPLAMRLMNKLRWGRSMTGWPSRDPWIWQTLLRSCDYYSKVIPSKQIVCCTNLYIYIISYVSVYLCLQYYTVYASESVSISESRSSPVSISMYLVLAILFRSYRGLTRSFTLSQQHVWPHP